MVALRAKIDLRRIKIKIKEMLLNFALSARHCNTLTSRALPHVNPLTACVYVAVATLLLSKRYSLRIFAAKRVNSLRNPFMQHHLQQPFSLFQAAFKVSFIPYFFLILYLYAYFWYLIWGAFVVVVVVSVAAERAKFV